jgi:hypothetical protein
MRGINSSASSNNSILMRGINYLCLILVAIVLFFMYANKNKK